MSIKFHLRSDDSNFLARVSSSGNAPGIYGPPTLDTTSLPTGTIGSSIINHDIGAASRGFLLYRGYDSIPAGQTISILHRLSITTGTGTVPLSFTGGPDDLRNDGIRLDVFNGDLYTTLTNANGNVGINNSQSVWGYSVNVLYDLVITWDGTTNANAYKVYVDGALIDQKTSTLAWLATRATNAINKISIAITEVSFSDTCKIKTNEYVIWDEVIDPTVTGLNLNGASRTSFVTSTAFDATNSTDPGESEVLDTAGVANDGVYIINGVTKTGTATASPTITTSNTTLTSPTRTGTITASNQ